MIETFYGAGALDSTRAFVFAAAIGVLFGFFLEQAGFASSRKLAGIFYFRDMTVLKVMFTALITAMLGLSFLAAFGRVRLDGLFLLPTVYGAQIAGGLVFGVGFVLGGWCPGTAAAGLAAGRIDALLFLAGAVAGSILFNEMFPMVRPLAHLGDRGVRFIYDSLGVPKSIFVFAFTIVAVICFWLAEFTERRVAGRGKYLFSPFLTVFSLCLILLAWGYSLAAPPVPGAEGALLTEIAAGKDHIEPEELAERLMAGGKDLVLVDIRPAVEYRAFHICGAVSVEMPRLAAYLAPRRNRGAIVLYSNGMTHPAQARDSLARAGYRNVYILTDGLDGFIARCLKPVSLRDEPLTPEQAARVAAWRRHFGDTSCTPFPPGMLQLKS